MENRLIPLAEMSLGITKPYRFACCVPTKSASALMHNLSNRAQQIAKQRGELVTYKASPFGEIILGKTYETRRVQLEFLFEVIRTHGARFDESGNVWHVEKLPASTEDGFSELFEQ